MGSYIGTCPSVWHLGEYRVFRMLYLNLTRPAGEGPYIFLDRYNQELRDHAESFASAEAAAHGCAYYCDSSPTNLWVASDLAAERLNAIFVLTLRHYSGVLQSLERAHAEGWDLMRGGLRARAEHWRSLYAHARFLPSERTIAVGYDRLCADPSATIAEFKSDWAARGLDPSELDDRALAQGYARRGSERTRPTLAARAPGKGLVMHSISSFDPARWSPAMDAEVTPIVEEVDADLRLRFPGAYTEPVGFPVGIPTRPG